jgi:hypothetical protein
MMTSFYVEMTFGEGQGPLTDVTLAHLDDVADAFADLDDVDGDVGVDTDAGQVQLCMTLTAETPPEALLKAFTAARTAVHTAGGHTGTWDGWLEKMLEDDQYRSSVAPSSWNDADCPA